ncbi:unnamed protein product, partial [Durusdinium trenchii]
HRLNRQVMATISIDVAVACNTRNEGKQRVMGAPGESFRQVQKVVVLKKFQLHAKEAQKTSAATGANTINFLQSLAVIRGDGGSARK